MQGTNPSPAVRFDVERQRASLLRLTASIGYLRSDEGARLLNEFELQLAPHALAEARSCGAGASAYSASDAVHTLIVNLLSDDGRVAHYAANATGEPWAYLATCLRRWVRKELGHRTETLTNEPTTPRPLEAAQEMNGLYRAAERCFRILAPYTPTTILDPVHRLVHWLAENPPRRRSYEGRERADAGMEFAELHRRHIEAVARIAWGTRPAPELTSLLGALLQDPQFHVAASPHHALALARYRRDMRSAEAFAHATDPEQCRRAA